MRALTTRARGRVANLVVDDPGPLRVTATAWHTYVIDLRLGDRRLVLHARDVTITQDYGTRDVMRHHVETSYPGCSAVWAAGELTHSCVKEFGHRRHKCECGALP